MSLAAAPPQLLDRVGICMPSWPAGGLQVQVEVLEGSILVLTNE
jgi:hypothetical protein